MFRPINLNDKQGNEKQDERSLEEIILSQKDEPHQRNCIFSKISYMCENIDDSSHFLRSEAREVNKYYQIRVKSIEFL